MPTKQKSRRRPLEVAASCRGKYAEEIEPIVAFFTVANVKRLGLFIAIWKKTLTIVKDLETFYRLEFFFPIGVSYYEGSGLGGDPEQWEWQPAPAGLRRRFGKRLQVEAATISVTTTGVFWEASPKHSDLYIETPELKWDYLEDLQRSTWK